MQSQLLSQALNQPFVQVALPIMATMLLAVWMNNKGFDGVNGRLNDITARLVGIEARLLGVETKLGTVERKVEALELKAWR